MTKENNYNKCLGCKRTKKKSTTKKKREDGQTTVRLEKKIRF